MDKVVLVDESIIVVVRLGGCHCYGCRCKQNMVVRVDVNITLVFFFYYGG